MLNSKRYFSFTTATQFGQVTFDEKGESRDLTIEQEQYLADRIEDFVFIDETPEPKKEVVPEPKPEEVKQPVKKRTTRKKADTTEE